MEFKNKIILLTGGHGFLGQHVWHRLIETDNTIISPPRKSYDLTNIEHIDELYDKTHPDIVIHLAAICGGIGANMHEPGRFFYENLIMNTNMMEYARKYDVEKYVAIGSICAFPKYCPAPFKEEDIWNGYLEEINVLYGLAKKMQLVQAQAYRDQYNFNAIYLSPVNLYGPKDNFDLETSHVIPAIIRKCHEAKENGDTHITLWGDGTPTREFLYVDDCARAIILATEYYDGTDPINIGTGIEITVHDLANIIKDIVGFNGTIRWDTSNPNGQPRRVLDISKAKESFFFEARISLIEGLKMTYESFKLHNILSAISK